MRPHDCAARPEVLTAITQVARSVLLIAVTQGARHILTMPGPAKLRW